LETNLLREYKKAQENFEKALSLDSTNIAIVRTSKWFKDNYHKFIKSRSKGRDVCEDNRK
jgi:hypothetical protein